MTDEAGSGASVLRGERPTVVFFDVGDTLLRVDPSWSAVYLRACREFGLAVDENELEAGVTSESASGSWDGGGPYEATMEASYQRVKAFDERIMARLGHAALPDRFYRRLGEIFLAAEAWHVFPEVRGVLDQVSAAGIRCLVVSNWVWGLPELLHDLDLAHHFEHVVVSSRVGYDKPHPAIFRHALRLAGVRADQAIHVGDNPATDVAGSRSAGLRAVLVMRGDRPAHGGPIAPGALEGVPVIADLTGLLGLLGLGDRSHDARLARPSPAATR